MAVGCVVAAFLWLAMPISVLLNSVVPAAVALILMLAMFVYRGLRSEWPLWY